MPGTRPVEQQLERRALVSPTTQRQLPGSRSSASNEVISLHRTSPVACWSENHCVASRRIKWPSANR
jgi:hypothetical protein